MKICVIGGSGFVGSRLLPKLLEIGVVSIFDKRESPFFPHLTSLIDIRDKNGLNEKLKDFDLVVHLAAEHTDNVSPTSLYYDVNVTGTRNILDAMVANRIHRLVFFSSVSVYGLNKPNPDENYPKEPSNHYGKSKLMAENLILEWSKNGEHNNAIIIRPTVIFGERNRGNLYTLLRQIASGKFIQIGKGDNVKSLAYVGNIVDFVKYIIAQESDECRIFNYCDKPDLNVNDIVNLAKTNMNLPITRVKIPYFIGYSGGLLLDLAALVTGRSYSISSVRIKKFCATTQFSSSKMLASGFIPPYSLTEGLKRTIEFEFVQKGADDVSFVTE